MGNKITRESLRAADSATITRMWNDVGGVCATLTDVDALPGPELMDLADILFDELVDRGQPVPHYPEMEDLLGIVEIEPEWGE